MGSKKSTSSSSSSSSNSNSGGSGNSYNDRQEKINQKKAIAISKRVKKGLGLTAVGGLGGNNEGYIASKADKPLMYGGEASRLTKKAMDAEGLGTYNLMTGSFTNIKDNKIISGADRIMGGTMGDGSNSVMGQIPISKKMFESQKRTKTLAMLGMSAVMPGIGGSLMRVAALREQSLGYNDYNTKFLNNKNQNQSSFQTNINQESRTASNETANKSMGETTTTTNKKSKRFSKYNSRSGIDTTGSIRNLLGTR